MLYPFMTLNDGTEITYSEPKADGCTIVNIETPIENGFKSATCAIPGYKWENHGYSEIEMEQLRQLVKSVAHLLIKYSREGGIASA